MVALFSSNINEGIRAVLFLLRKYFTRTKSTKTHISKQKQKKQHFYALKKNLRRKKSPIRLFAFLCFLCAFYAFLCVKQKRQHFYADKNISEEVVCLAFCAFYAFYMHKKHLRGGKPLVCVLYFLCFLCV